MGKYKPAIEDLSRITSEQYYTLQGWDTSTLSSSERLKSYGYGEFDTITRIKIAEQFLDPENRNHKEAREHIEYFLKNNIFKDREHIPSILLNALLGRGESIITEVCDKSFTEFPKFRKFYDLTVGERVALLGHSNGHNSKNDPSKTLKELIPKTKGFDDLLSYMYDKSRLWNILKECVTGNVTHISGGVHSTLSPGPTKQKYSNQKD